MAVEDWRLKAQSAPHCPALPCCFGWALWLAFAFSKARSAPQCPAVSAWQSGRFWALWLAVEPCSICVSKAATPSERESTLRYALTAWQLRTAARRAARSWPICRLWNAYRTKFKGEPKVKNVRWATQKRQGTAGQIAPSKKQSPRLNSMAVKDGKLLRGPPGCGWFACEALIEQGLKASQRAQKRPFCHAETAGHSGADRAFEKAPFATP